MICANELIKLMDFHCSTFLYLIRITCQCFTAEKYFHRNIIDMYIGLKGKRYYYYNREKQIL